MQTILIVDDVSDNIKLLKDLLQDEGYTIKVANNGQRALDIVAKEPIADLVLLDVMMPVMNGYEVCKKLKSNEKTANIPVIFVTAKNKTEDEEMGFEMGAVDYVSKPISRTTVLARVKTHLKLKELMDNLSKKVDKETTLRLFHEETLIQQSKQAIMGEMIDAIAHQWMQPLSVMSMDVEMLNFDFEFEEDVVDSKYMNDFYTKFCNQVDHLTNTMNEFRTFLRPVNHDESFNIDEAIESTLILLKDALLTNDIQVHTELQKDVLLQGSATEFKHILINLINNAKDAFVDNNISNRTIDIILKNDNKIFLEVVDNAGGIPLSIIDQIFEPNITTKSKGKGTGIGLYMSQQIAQKFHCLLKVDNTADGSKFIFTTCL